MGDFISAVSNKLTHSIISSDRYYTCALYVVVCVVLYYFRITIDL